MNTPTHTGPQAQEAGEPLGYTSARDIELMPVKDSCVLSFHPLLVRDPRDDYTIPVYATPSARVVSDAQVKTALAAMRDKEVDLFGEPKTPDNGARTECMRAALSTLQSGAEGKDGDALDAARYRWLVANRVYTHGKELRYGDTSNYFYPALSLSVDYFISPIPLEGREFEYLERDDRKVKPHVDAFIDAAIAARAEAGGKS